MLVRRKVEPYETVPPATRTGRDAAAARPAAGNAGGCEYILDGGLCPVVELDHVYLAETFRLTTGAGESYAWFPPIASTLGAFAGGWMSRRVIARGSGALHGRVSAIGVSAFGCLICRGRSALPYAADGHAGGGGELFLDHGGQRQSLHDSFRHLGRRARGCRDFGACLCIWTAANGYLARDRIDCRWVWFRAGVLDDRVAAADRMAVAQTNRARAAYSRAPLRRVRPIQSRQHLIVSRDGKAR